jgi:hypothetical protein
MTDHYTHPRGGRFRQVAEAVAAYVGKEGNGA